MLQANGQVVFGVSAAGDIEHATGVLHVWLPDTAHRMPTDVHLKAVEWGYHRKLLVVDACCTLTSILVYGDTHNINII